MLEEIEKDVYNLSEHHLAARDFIISAGKMEKSASAAGKKARQRKKIGHLEKGIGSSGNDPEFIFFWHLRDF